jgi:hypothetical protein
LSRKKRRRHAQEARVMRLLRDARRAQAAGHLSAAITLQSTAHELVRALVADHPEDRRQAQMLGGILYNHASLLNEAGCHEEAIGALDESEEVYSGLSGEALPVDAWIADVRARRGITHAARGAGASALADAQSALLGYRMIDTVADLDVARVLALSSDVFGTFGDPDLAVATADFAIQVYTNHFEMCKFSPRCLPSRHAGYFARAAEVSALIRAAHGYDQVGQAARPPTGRAYPDDTPPRLTTVLKKRLFSTHPPALTNSFDTALRAAANKGGTTAERLHETLVRDAADRAVLVPLDRLSLSTATAAGPNVAGGWATGLANLAETLLPVDPTSGMRLGLEAHCLFAGYPFAQTASKRGDLGDGGAVWARVLLSCRNRAESTGDTAFASDLAAWAARTAQPIARAVPGGRNHTRQLPAAASERASDSSNPTSRL